MKKKNALLLICLFSFHCAIAQYKEQGLLQAIYIHAGFGMNNCKGLSNNCGVNFTTIHNKGISISFNEEFAQSKEKPKDYWNSLPDSSKPESRNKLQTFNVRGIKIFPISKRLLFETEAGISIVDYAIVHFAKNTLTPCSVSNYNLSYDNRYTLGLSIKTGFHFLIDKRGFGVQISTIVSINPVRSFIAQNGGLAVGFRRN